MSRQRFISAATVLASAIPPPPSCRHPKSIVRNVERYKEEDATHHGSAHAPGSPSHCSDGLLHRRGAIAGQILAIGFQQLRRLQRRVLASPLRAALVAALRHILWRRRGFGKRLGRVDAAVPRRPLPGWRAAGGRAGRVAHPALELLVRDHAIVVGVDRCKQTVQLRCHLPNTPPQRQWLC